MDSGQAADAGTATTPVVAAEERLPRLVATAYLLVFVVLNTIEGRGRWFYTDAWDALARSLGDPSAWVEAHHAHWNLVQVLTLRPMYLVAGLDFWPWYSILAALAAATTGVAAGWSLRHRGASPMVSLAALVVVPLLVRVAYPSHLSDPIAIAAGIIVATVMGSTDRGARAACVAAGLVGVVTKPYGVATVGIAAVAGLAVPSWRRNGWWWPPMIPAVVYAAWRVLEGPRGGRNLREGAGLVTETATYLYDIVRTGVGFDGVAAVVVLVLAAGWCLWALATRRVDAAGLILLGTATGIAAATIALRSGHSYTRFSGPTLALLLAAFGPAIRSKVLAIGIAVLAVFAHPFRLGPDATTRRMAEPQREMFAALAHLADEPAATTKPHLHYPMFGPYLTDAALAGFLADGYEPPPVDGEALERARGALRVRAWPAGQPDGAVIPVAGCVDLPPGETASWPVLEAGALVVDGGVEGPITWGWVDRYGRGTGATDERMTQRFDGRIVLHVAPPAGETRLTLGNETGEPATICVDG